MATAHILANWTLIDTSRYVPLTVTTAQGAIANHALRNASQEELGQSTALMRADDDEIGPSGAGGTNDLADGFAAA